MFFTKNVGKNPQKHWSNYAMRDGLQTVNRGGRQSVTRLKHIDEGGETQVAY